MRTVVFQIRRYGETVPVEITEDALWNQLMDAARFLDNLAELQSDGQDEGAHASSSYEMAWDALRQWYSADEIRDALDRGGK